MFHVLHDVFKHGVGHVADKQVLLRMAFRQKCSINVRGFSYHGSDIRAFSYRCQADSWFQLPPFVVLVTNLRGNGYRSP